MVLMLAIAWFFGGLVVLTVGGDLLVRGASRMAVLCGVQPLIVGLTIVAIGTSAPELAVSVAGAWSGSVDIAVGNVVGSNTFNLAFILGASGLIIPLVVDRRIVRFDAPVMVILAMAMAYFGRDGVIDRGDGLLLLGAMMLYIGSMLRAVKRLESASEESPEATQPIVGSSLGGLGKQIFFMVVGLALLIAGSRGLVHGAVTVAQLAGMSELLIGLTIVAIGTSLPEVATSVLAAIKGERDIAVGNVIGSNIFNTTAVLGTTAVLAPSGLPISENVQSLDLPVMLTISILALPMLATDHLLRRWEGLVFLAAYVGYTSVLVLDAIGSPQVDRVVELTWRYVIPGLAGILFLDWLRYAIQLRRGAWKQS